MPPLKPARTAAFAAIPVTVVLVFTVVVTALGTSGNPARATLRSASRAALSRAAVRHSPAFRRSDAVRRPGAVRGSAVAARSTARVIGITGTGLFRLAPVQAFNVSQVSSGPVRVGAVTYADSIRFTCDRGSHISSGDLDYSVTGYDSLTTTITVVPGQSGTASVSFFDNGTGAQVTGPYQVRPGHPRTVRVRFPAASQLEISCTPANARSAGIALALANPVLSSH